MEFSEYEKKAKQHLEAAESLLVSPYMEPREGAIDNRDLRDAHIGMAQAYATLAIMPIS